MKKIFVFIISLCMFFSGGIKTEAYAAEKTMYGAWITTVYGLDWPKTKGAEAQQQEMRDLLDKLKDTGINTVMFQVRSKGDALYQSSINPWSSVLTGTQGQNPGYDPLAFVIEEAEKRDMKVHAWLNPYRVTTYGTDLSKLHPTHPARQNDWTIEHDGNDEDKIEELYYNPDLPEVTQHVVDTVEEIVNNYKVDGIVFDDYFYPADYPLPAGETRDGRVANERRSHITDMVRQVNNKIKTINPLVEFGVSPRGVWKNSLSDNGSGTDPAKESYYSDSADTVTWIKNEYIDYVIPQVYWEMSHTVAPYKIVTSWWANVVNGTNVDLYIGHGIYKTAVASEIDTQLEYNKAFSTIKGSVFYDSSDIINNTSGSRDKIKNFISENSKISFTDISGHWAEEEIIEFIDRGYVAGYPDATFRPENSITRAEFVRITNQALGFSTLGEEKFNDVSDKDWFYKDICIAVKAGYIKGKSETIFDPNTSITREEAATIITSIKNNKGYEPYDNLQNYKDANQVSSWAKPYMEGAIESNYLYGYGDGTIKPKNKVTRAEAVAILQRVQ